MKNFAYRHYFSSAARVLQTEALRHVRLDPAVLVRKGFATLLSGLLIFQPVLLQAQQLMPDTNAPVGNQPGVGTAPNGVPLVDIVTPNGQGLSHNKYHDFNVGNPGLILNNHNGEVGTSRLGGVTPGNPNLKNSGPASVILNEVTSGNRSALQGATEVFGGRADVIIANPNGITCDGCGFINTPRATLTTGKPDIDGSGRLSGFTVQGGDVTFGSKGGNFAFGDGAVDLFDIVSRRVQLDGPVNGKHLRLSAGRQKFNYATGEVTALNGADDAGEFAIDGSALGAMQADRIRIIVTDKGAGVRMRGDMAAHAGELTLSADGRISLGNTSGRDGISVQSRSRQVEARKVTSKKRVVVKAAKGITLEAVSADEDVILESGAGLLSVAGDVTSLGNIELTSSGAITTGNVAAGRNASLQAGQGITTGQINADGAATLTTVSGDIALSGTAKSGGGALNITATSGSISAASLVSFNNMTLTAGQAIRIGDTILSGGALVASARTVKATSAVSGVDFTATNAANGAIQIKTTGDMRLSASGAIDVSSLLSAGNLDISATALAAQNVTSHGIVTIAGDTNIAGQILGSSNVSITGANIKAGAIISGVEFASSKASSSGAIVVGNTGDTTLIAQAGTIDVGTLLSAGNLLGNAATFKATNVTSHGTTNISGMTAISGQLLSGSDITIKGASIGLGTAVAGVDLAALEKGNVVLGNAPRALNLTATSGNLTANRLLSSGDAMASATGNLTANILSHGALDLTAGGTLALSGQSLAGGNATLTAGTINLDTLVSGVDFAATEQSGGALILKTGVASAGQMSLVATGGATTASGSITADQLLSAGSLTVNAGTFAAGNVTSNDTATITGNTTISGQLLAGSDVSVTGQAVNIGTVVAGVDPGALSNGNIATGSTAHTLNLLATAGDIAVNRLLSSGDAVASATGNLSANALAHGDLDLTAGGTLTLSGQSLSGGNATLDAGSINVGTLVSGVDFAATEQSEGSLILKTGVAGAGQMSLAATAGSITADQLLSGGDLRAKAKQNITYNSLQSFASADLNAVMGAISLDRKTVAKGDIALTLQSLDLSNDRSKLATAGTLIVNAASANLANSTLTFGGLTLNLSGVVDASNAKIHALSPDGSSGDITIAATTITTTATTALLAANDLTLTLASLTNPGQLAANNNLTFNISGNFTNTATGLVYAGQDGRLYVAGDLLNDQGAILVGQDLTIAANADGARNSSITNVSGLIKAERDATITTANLTNRRSSVPTWSDVVVSNDEIVKFILNPETWGKPLGALFVDPKTGLPLDAYGEDVERATTAEWMSQLYGVITLADGTSYRTRPFVYSDDNTPWDYVGNYKSVEAMLAALGKYYPTDADGNIILTPDLQSKMILIVNNDDTYAEGHVWDDDTGMRQTIHEQEFDGPLSPEALIQTGRNLNIDATILNNAYSSIEAGGDAKLTGSVLNNEGVALYRTVTSTCEATGGCEAYDANGNRDGVNDLDKGNSRVTSQTIVDGAFGNIKAAGNMDISGFATVNNTSAEGSIAGGAELSTAPVTDDPTKALNDMTAGGALFTPNSAINDLIAGKGLSISGNGLQAGGLPLSPAEIIAALGSSAPKPDSGGFGGTIPNQVFLYETRAEFLDVAKFYGSGYFINRIGYNPDKSIPFLGDAYFENQLIDQQLRELVNQGLGKGSFIPGSDAIGQMKTLLDRGADFAKQHGLAIGEKLSPELIANLTGTMVWYEKKTVNGIEVLVPTVYIANTDKANLSVAGSIISGDSVVMNVGEVNNSGMVSAKTDLKLDATSITATGGSFTAGNNLALSASQNITIASADMQIGGETFAKSGSGVNAGGNASLASGNELTLRGAGVKAGNDVSLTGQNVTLDTAKATNKGSDNVIGTTVKSGGDTNITATDNVSIIGSDVAAGGNLDIEAEQGSVNVVAAGVDKKINGGGNHMSQTDRTFAQESSLTSGGDTSIKAGDDILIAGSKVKAKGDLSLKAKDDITVAAAEETNRYALDTQSKGLFKSSESHTRTDTQTTAASSISGGTGVNISSGDNTIISASKVQAGTEDQKADLNIATGGDLIIASGKDTSETDKSTSGSGFLTKSSSKSHTYDETTVASDLSASGNVNLNANRNVVIAGSNVTAGDNIGIEGDSVSIIGAQEQHDLETESRKSGLGAGSGDGFYSIWGKEKKSHSESATVNVGSTLSAGGDVSITARETDVNIIGSQVTAGNDIALEAERDVNILPGAESYLSEDKESRSGIGIQVKTGNGSASIGIGYGSSKDEFRQGAETNAVSSLSAGRDVIITAGRDANLQAAQVDAGSTVDILAERDVNLLSAQDKTNYEYMHEELFVGVTATVTSQAAAAVGNAYEAASRVGDGSTANSIAMATIAGINGKYAYDVLDGANEKNNWNPGEQLISGSLSVGFQYEKNSAEGSSSFPVPTTISAGDTVIIEAGRDINAEGAQISAGYDQYGLPTGGRGDIALIAGNDINLESAKATTENSSKNVSGGISVDLLNPGVSFNYGQGKGNDTTVTNINTHVTGSGTVYVQSGNDTNLRGATVSGETVIADIGGDLNIESQLDTATAKSKQVNVNGSIGQNAQGNTTGGISGSYQTAKGDAAIVSEQSGIHAGEGGFDIKVDGNTKLQGGLITSEAEPENNRLETGTLEFEDLDTHSKWKADAYGGGITGSGPIVSPPIREGESDTGKALSAISSGEIDITDPDNQQQNIDDLRRDTTDTNTSLPGIPDLQKLLDEQLKTQQLYDDAAAKAAKMIGDYATAKAKAALDNGQLDEYEFWKEGGNGPAILHAIAGGLLGGVTDFSGMLSGMTGGAMSAKLAPQIHKLVEQFVKDAGLTGSAADLMVNTITGSILQGLGAATGGSGAAYAGNTYQNNYLKHEEITAYNDEMRQCGDNPDCQYRVFSEYFEISANRNDEVAACETEECRKTHYDDFMKAKEVANLILNPFNHNNDAYYTALFALQSNELNSKVNEIAMARVEARNNAREECGANATCTQRKTDEYFQLWSDEKEHKQILGSVAGAVLGAFNGLHSTKRRIDYDKISTAKPGQATQPRNLDEQVLWNEVIRNPASGQKLDLNKDLRFPATSGWQKMEATHTRPDGTKISIHYQYNSITKKAYDMKLTNPQ